MAVPSKTFQVQAISPGIAMGRVMVLQRHSGSSVPVKKEILASEIDGEMDRFFNAVSITKSQLLSLKEEMTAKLHSGDTAIIDVLITLTDDPSLTTEVKKRISKDLWNVEYAIYDTVETYAQVFAEIKDEYLKERILDIKDVASRIMDNLSNSMSEEVKAEYRRIIFAPSLTPFQTAHLDSNTVLGFAVETGSQTCHTAILARSMRLPAVSGIPTDLLDSLGADDKVIIDGFAGKLIVNPDARQEEAYRLKLKETGDILTLLTKDNSTHSETSDGFVIRLAANIETIEQLEEARQLGAHGVGLFRTEFLFMNPYSIPGEEEQFEIYKKLLIASGDEPVTIRTMDIGGDKLCTGVSRNVEKNPFLGLRGIRLSLYERKDLFITQIRALMRAGVFGNLRILIPMVSSLIEVQEVKEIISQQHIALHNENINHLGSPALGVMIETPAAALMADKIGALVDFFSIGTNDLVQYTMAIDRENDRVAYLYKPSHPAILQLIKLTVEAAKKNRIFVAVCGQTAADPFMAPLLLGLGIQELSMSPTAIPMVRHAIRALAYSEAEAAANKALTCLTAAEALEIIEDLMRERAPELFLIN